MFQFEWLLTAMQFSKCIKSLYMMNNNSIWGLTYLEIFFSLCPLHENGSLSYTPICLLSQINSERYLILKIIYSVTKYLIKHPDVYLLSSVSTLKKFSVIYVIRHIKTLIIGT